MNKLGIVGCGKMGCALIEGILNKLDEIVCYDIRSAAVASLIDKFGVEHIKAANDISNIALSCDTVILAVKPAQALEVLDKMTAAGGPPQTVLSIVAGIPVDKLQSHVSAGSIIVRIMPNTPALVGSGATVVLDNGLDDETRHTVTELMSATGAVHFVTEESKMDAVTGLSGSCPALFAMMIEALADAAVSEGLPRKLALDLARETMLGTAKLLEVQHPAILKESVMSPGGTTAAGVIAAEHNGFRAAAASFVSAASAKSRLMG